MPMNVHLSNRAQGRQADRVLRSFLRLRPFSNSYLSASRPSWKGLRRSRKHHGKSVLIPKRPAHTHPSANLIDTIPVTSLVPCHVVNPKMSKDKPCPQRAPSLPEEPQMALVDQTENKSESKLETQTQCGNRVSRRSE